MWGKEGWEKGEWGKGGWEKRGEGKEGDWRECEWRKGEGREDERREVECYKSRILHVFTLIIVNFWIYNHIFVGNFLCWLDLH